MHFILLSALWAAQAGDFDREEERANMLAQIGQVRESKLVFLNYGKAPLSHRRLLDELRRQTHAEEAINALTQEYHILKIALDRALYRDGEEKAAWQRRMEEIAQRASEFEALEESRNLRKLNNLARGLSGSFVKSVRRGWRNHQRFASRPKDRELESELNRLGIEVQDIRNNSPFAVGLGANNKKMKSVIKRYRQGKMNFAKLTDTFKDLRSRGMMAMGADILERGREHFNRIAVLKTELARRRGFPNWAAMQLAFQETGYGKGLRSADERIRFLRHILRESRPYEEAHLKRMAKNIPELAGRTLKQWTELEVSLSNISRSKELPLWEYFPVERVEELWRQTMLESGFSPAIFDLLSFDGFPRMGKQAHAYMSPVFLAAPKVLKIDALNLNWHQVPRWGRNNYHPPSIYIVQNFYGDGLEAYETAFHEGGHFLDFANRLNTPGDIGSSYAYDETASMGMEKFIEDPAWLAANSRHKITGNPLSAKQIQNYLRRRAASEALNLRYTFASSLFDLELWNAPFDENTETFVERALRLHREHHQEFAFGRLEEPEGAARFITGHFTGGSVRHIGYSLASLSALMVHERLLDQLEAKTGRRSLYRQPSLAALWIKLFRRGHATEFPKIIEDFTGRPFEVGFATELIGKGFGGDDCGLLLKR